MWKRVLALFWLTILCFAIPYAVSANTLPGSWEGTSGHELRIAEDCPVQVKKERLSFRIDSRKREYTAQSTITAIYTLYNPTDETCIFPAVFPVVLARSQETPDAQTILLDGKPLPFDVQEAAYSEQEILDGLTSAQLLENAIPEGAPNDYTNGDGNSRVLLLTFELELPPGETSELRVNTVTQAFMEQERILHYISTETRYTFYYYLSPAQYWDSFEDITIDLRLSSAAPVLTDSSLPFFWAGPRRYLYHSQSLPDGELSFTVKSSLLYTILRWIHRFGLLVCGMILIINLKNWIKKRLRKPK